MNKNLSVHYWINIFLTACFMTFALVGCGDDGAPGAAGTPGPGVAPLASSTELNITITSASISSAPVVNFTVTNQDGVAVAGFADSDLRFNISKLIPGSPSKWQSYLNRVSGGGVLGTQERSGSGNVYGTLVDHKNGSFTYTFATDITSSTANPCPAPCTDADGNALDISYQPSVTHRIGIQQNNTLLPKANATYDFVPAGGSVTSTREITGTAKCNECHNQLGAHGGGMRIDTKLCVTCHNPGSWMNTTGNIQTVDFPVMIHKIHHGDELPSVNDATNPTPYAIGSHDFSDVAFPQDIRNCTKCHDGTSGAANATANGDVWKNAPTKAACGACHDDVYFGLTASKLYQTVSHMDLITAANGTPVADPADSTCTSCHATGQLAGGVDEVHAYPGLVEAEAAKFKFNVLTVTNSAPTQSPVITFSVTDPTNSNAVYDIKTDARFSGASLSLMVGWNNDDENNTGSTSNPGQPPTVNLLGANAVDNFDGTYTVDLATATLGNGVTNRVIPVGTTGSGRVAIYGRAAVDVDGDTVVDRVPVKAAYKDFAITDATAVARRTVVDINKCNNCHDHLSLHGESRTDEPGLCVICHNPSATDVTKRPKYASGSGQLTGYPDATAAADGKAEESIDFKRMIHSIHGAGFRENGLVIYGYNSSVNDFSGLRFPGILNDCLTCHVTPTGNNAGSYELSGNWEVPTASGILGSTVRATPNLGGSSTYVVELADQTDDLNITPTAAVCTSCHDGVVARSHMVLNGALFDVTQTAIAGSGTLEACAICHGPGRIADVKTVHGVD
jgi:OmcA/MtrC family decaheme c-type cytochrome